MTTTRRRMLALTFGLPAVALLGACTRRYVNHGYVPPEGDLAQIVVGQTNQADLAGLIGQPGAQGLLTGSAWYYVGSRWELYGPNPPKEINREVVAISFGPNGTVTNVERFGLERGRVVVLSRRVTETGVSGTSVIRQLLSNIGNFNPGEFFN
ncbi:MAG: outer membrane protein assembly factor BamE [Paracoccus denitrificans]|nr:MAG: outer membrane protein assembly factor BamE [Paracoccus denitrificans]PZO84734.1 MAG: outer membrane protein assembly factor BamE [Paracoccus denitrificans]